MEEYTASQLEQDLELTLVTAVPALLLPFPLPSEKLLGYLKLLLAWGKKMDLVSQTDPGEVSRAHIVDSLVAAIALSPLPRARVLDIGSGAGLPGVVLACCWDDSEVVLCEPREKRALFLSEVVRKLSLKNVRVENCRIEQIRLLDCSLGISRAVGMEAEVVRFARSGERVSGLAWMVAQTWSPPADVHGGSDWNYEVPGLIPHKIAYRLPS